MTGTTGDRVSGISIIGGSSKEWENGDPTASEVRTNGVAAIRTRNLLGMELESVSFSLSGMAGSTLKHRVRRRGGPCGDGVEVGEAQVAGSIATVDCGLLLFGDGEGGVDVTDVVPVGDAVQVEEHRVKLGAQAKAAPLVPTEGKSCTAPVSST